MGKGTQIQTLYWDIQTPEVFATYLFFCQGFRVFLRNFTTICLSCPLIFLQRGIVLCGSSARMLFCKPDISISFFKINYLLLQSVVDVLHNYQITTKFFVPCYNFIYAVCKFCNLFVGFT